MRTKIAHTLRNRNHVRGGVTNSVRSRNSISESLAAIGSYFAINVPVIVYCGIDLDRNGFCKLEERDEEKKDRKRTKKHRKTVWHAFRLAFFVCVCALFECRVLGIEGYFAKISKCLRRRFHEMCNSRNHVESFEIYGRQAGTPNLRHHSWDWKSVLCEMNIKHTGHCTIGSSASRITLRHEFDAYCSLFYYRVSCTWINWLDTIASTLTQSYNIVWSVAR